MNLEKKRELLLKWKESGLSLPKWWKENADKLNLPHLSTLYAWVKEVGFSTEPGAKVINEHNEEQEEYGEVHDEREDLDDSQEEDDQGAQVDSQGFGEKEEDDDEEKEVDGEPEEEVIAKDRIEKLAPVTVPEPAPSKKPADTPKMGIKAQTWIIIGGAVILGIGAYVLINKIGKRKEQKEQNNAMRGGNPFAGYVTVDEF